MNEFVFDRMPWEEELDALEPGAQLSAARFLALMEQEDPLTVEEAFDRLEQRQILLDISDLPKVVLTGDTALRLKQEEKLSAAGDVTTGLDENDPLRLYLQELAGIPAAGDPQLLAERYHNGAYDLAEALVNLCLGRVVEIAKSYTGHGVLLMDLIQEGSLGLWQSILTFDGGDFISYADRFIHRYLAKSVTMYAHTSGAGQKLRQQMEDYLDADQRLLAELGRNPTQQEIGAFLHLSEEETATLEKMVATARMLQRAKAEQEPAEPEPEDEQAVEDTAYFQLRQRIQELLSGLSPEDAKLLALRFGLEGGQPLSPAQTGQLLGLTPEEVVCREAAALSRLRGQ